MPRAPKYELPKTLFEAMYNGDFEEIKAVFQDPEMLKYLVNSKKHTDNPLFRDTPCTEIYKWFVEQGFDINMKNIREETPIFYHARTGDTNLEGIILAGADIESKYMDSYTPLLYAAKNLSANALKTLIKYGADVHAQTSDGKSPITLVLDRWELHYTYTRLVVECLEILIEAGAEIQDGSKDKVLNICKEFENGKDAIPSYNDNLEPFENAMTRLCELIGVERPASEPKAQDGKVHDGKSAITVTATDWREQHAELWKMLVPARGKCKTVQGETVRICGKINDEIFNQGGAHWDAEFRKMLNALKKYYEMGTIPDEAEYKEALELIKTIGKNSGGEDVLRLCEINIHWVLANPEPIELGEVNYKR